MNKLDFCIVGAQKSASSSVASILECLPEINMPHFECPFFEDPFYQDSKSDLLKIKNGKINGIKRPDYLCKEEIPRRLYEHNPNLKIIIILRDPADRVISSAYWYMQVGLIPVDSLDNTIKKLLAGELQATYPKSEEILEYSIYSKALERYYEFFERRNVLILSNENLRVDFKKSMQKICRFLSVKFDKNRIKNVRKKSSIYSPLRLKYLSFINRKFFFKLKHIEGDRYYHEVRNDYMISAFRLLKLLDSLVLSRVIKSEKETLSPSTLKKLKSFLADEIKVYQEIMEAHGIE